MFYAHYVLSKRGPLARIWLAAHWDKKLTKAHVFETNLEDSVETIISPQVKMALRTSGHLLLGVVRIYNRKAKYLLADCNEAFVKIKMAFRSGVVDLPEESREAQHNQIYIVEEFPNFDTPLPDITDFDVNRHLTLNQSRIDEITMPDEAPTTLPMDESYGGVMVDGQFGDGMHGVFDQKAGKDLSFIGGDAMKDGAFGEIDEGGILGENFLKDGGGLFGEAQEESFLGEGFGRKEPQEEIPMETADGAMDGQMMSPAPPPVPEQPEEQPHEGVKEQEDPDKVIEGEKMDGEKGIIDTPMEIVEGMVEASVTNIQQQQQPIEQVEHIEQVQQQQQQAEQQQHEEETNKEQQQQATEAAEETVIKAPETTFALEPLNVSDHHNVRIRRKRKLIIDHVIELDGQTMREQLRDVDDIVTTLDMAPPTKRLMLWKEMGGVDKLFSLPCQMTGDRVNKIFTLNLHNTVPSHLIDMTGTQMQEKFGESIVVEEPEHQQEEEEEQQQEQEPQPIVNESVVSTEQHNVTESTVEIQRKDTTDTSIQYQQPSMDMSNFHVPANDESSIIQGDNDLCMNQINAIEDSDDDYDAMSNGPPSVGDSVGAPSPSIPLGVDFTLNMDNVLGEPQPPSINDTLASADTRVSIEPEQREREPEPEGEAYADDLEDLRWNKRTQYLLNDLDRKFKTESEVSFFRLSDGITRKQAVSKFYSLLVLAKQEAVNLSQSEVFGDVYIKEGSKFNNVLMP